MEIIILIQKHQIIHNSSSIPTMYLAAHDNRPYINQQTYVKKNFFNLLPKHTKYHYQYKNIKSFVIHFGNAHPQYVYLNNKKSPNGQNQIKSFL